MKSNSALLSGLPLSTALYPVGIIARELHHRHHDEPGEERRDEGCDDADQDRAHSCA